MSETTQPAAAHGRHYGTSSAHTVEGTDPHLHVEVHEPEHDAGLRPILLLHGFASNSALNWVDSGWLNALLTAGRRIILVDLPGHGRSSAPDDVDAYSPSRIRADLLQLATDVGARPLRNGDPASGLDLVGYSFGSRLAWEFAATQPELVHRVVLGGPSSTDPLAAFDLAAATNYLATGTPIADESTASLLRMAQALPANNIFALLALVEAVSSEPFDPAEAIPNQPLLLIAGDRDERASTMDALAALAPHAQQQEIRGRNHINVVTSRAFKTAAIEFLAAD
ncbi:MAG: alpha/beta hydrolase [Acidobacteria bacterium]|nr:alpha/beta hydrolase [Acidobacteriota bacterium]